AETCALLEDVTIELNLSCPNVDEAPESAAEIVAACRAATHLPLYAKLSPATWDVAETAKAVEEAGADGLSLVNTLRGLALDEGTLRPRLGTAVGGLSAPALRPVALAAVWACYRAVSLPIVGMGGITSGRDALDLIAAGAMHVAIGTVLFADPDAPARIRRELASEAAARGFADPSEARGIAHVEARSLDERSRVTAEKALELGRNLALDPRDSGASIPRRGHQDAGAGAGSIARPAHGRPPARERHPRAPREAEEGPEGRSGQDRGDPPRPARVRVHGEGLRHADGRAEVR